MYGDKESEALSLSKLCVKMNFLSDREGPLSRYDVGTADVYCENHTKYTNVL